MHTRKRGIVRIPMLPKWFNSHGMKISLGIKPMVIPIRGYEVIMSNGDIASLQIKPSLKGGFYRVIWRINHSPDEYVEGQIELSKDQLKIAFNLTPTNNNKSMFAGLFNADVGIQGSYIREGLFLNIPFPGTGMDGDPNISIFVSDEIKKAVRELIDSQE